MCHNIKAMFRVLGMYNFAHCIEWYVYKGLFLPNSTRINADWRCCHVTYQQKSSSTNFIGVISPYDFDTNFETILFYDIQYILIYSPISHLSPENLAKHKHFPVYLSQVWSVVLSLRQLQAVEN